MSIPEPGVLIGIGLFLFVYTKPKRIKKVKKKEKTNNGRILGKES